MIKGGYGRTVPAIPRLARDGGAEAQFDRGDPGAIMEIHVIRIGWVRLARKNPVITINRRRGNLGLLAAVVAMAPLTAAVAGDGAFSRDAVWRSIFARPAPTETGQPWEDKRRSLGAQLFQDPRLSGSGTRACSTCHQPERAFTDGLRRAAGADGTPLQRNTPHLWNLKDATSFYWDGREATLESQARVPMLTPNELGADLARSVALLAADAETARAFANAFPDDPAVSEANIIAALTAYERGLISPKTQFDFWVEGIDDALSAMEKRGFAIFVGKGGCVSCHGGWRMTDDQFHDIGLPGDDPGRSAVPGGTPGMAAFKTPGLRQVSKTAPYMHDGSLARLEDVIAHYAGNMRQRPSLAPNLVRDLKLDADERAALMAFLQTL